MKRPLGIYALCVLLLWSLAIDVHRWHFAAVGFTRAHASGPLHRVAAVLLILVPFAAASAILGIWRLRRWGIVAFGAWSVLAAAQAGLILLIVAGLGGYHAVGWLALGGVWAVSSAILLGLWLYVRGTIRAAVRTDRGPALRATGRK
jgi:hypothetical protein